MEPAPPERPSAIRIALTRVLSLVTLALVLVLPLGLVAIWPVPLVAVTLGGCLGLATLTGEWLGARWLGPRAGAAVVATLVPLALSAGALQVVFSVATLMGGVDAGYGALGRVLDRVTAATWPELSACVGVSAGLAQPLARSTFARLSPARPPLVLRAEPIGVGFAALVLTFPLSIADGPLTPPGVARAGTGALTALVACAGVTLVVVGALHPLGERVAGWALRVDRATPVVPVRRSRASTWVDA